jgi:hypothetical protein
MNPVSNSQASSSLMQTKEIKVYLIYFIFPHYYEPESHAELFPKKIKQRVNNRRTANKRKLSPVPTESAREIFVKQRRMTRHIRVQFSRLLQLIF